MSSSISATDEGDDCILGHFTWREYKLLILSTGYELLTLLSAGTEH